jgi:hypothetical protein
MLLTSNSSEMNYNKSRQQGRFAQGPLNSGPYLKRYKPKGCLHV